MYSIFKGGVFRKAVTGCWAILVITLLSGCQEDLMPSDQALEPSARSQVGVTLEDRSFTLSDAQQSTLSERLQTADAVVLYFTMWCPVCDLHMSHIRDTFKRQYPSVDFILVDYVSGTIAASEQSRTSSGYRDFDVIADVDNALERLFSATMASTVVIDKNFIVQFQEEFKDGSRLVNVLDQL